LALQPDLSAAGPERSSGGRDFTETAIVLKEPARYSRPQRNTFYEGSGPRIRLLRDATLEVLSMYAVIRTGGKQYRVAPGDKLKIETTAHEDGNLEFSDVIAVSGEEGKFEQELGGAKVLASVVGTGRGDKILVFKLKRKKQYKKMQGHRQNFVEVKINEILVNGKSFKA
jgi:large subunit ribosomal protein L21